MLAGELRVNWVSPNTVRTMTGAACGNPPARDAAHGDGLDAVLDLVSYAPGASDARIVACSLFHSTW